MYLTEAILPWKLKHRQMYVQLNKFAQESKDTPYPKCRDVLLERKNWLVGRKKLFSLHGSACLFHLCWLLEN